MESGPVAHRLSLCYGASCCVNTGGAGKLIFGSGTSLTIETKEKVEPDYFTLKDENNTLCLATGFSRYEATLGGKYNEEFNRTKPVRIAEDSLYNQVIFLNPDATCDNSTETQLCAAVLKPDEMVNLASLTILGLRVIFFKAVIFNVLMTLRLWMSQ
ncbi:M1-specific T cell receptor alpha chain isoform 6-T6 [Odontesthes bonariensis]